MADICSSGRMDLELALDVDDVVRYVCLGIEIADICSSGSVEFELTLEVVEVVR
jgi:hypothetical protein